MQGEAHMALDQLITTQDIEDAKQIASDIVINRDSKYDVFTDNPEIIQWCKVRSSELVRNLTTGLGDPKSITDIATDVVESILMEACLVGIIFSAKLTYAEHEDAIPPKNRDIILLELWERGLLPDAHYDFDPGKDKYLQTVLANHRKTYSVIDRINKMKKHGG